MTQHEDVTAQVWDFVSDYINRNGFAPSHREIADGCFLSKSAVVRHLDRLEARGHIEREPNQARSIRLMKQSE
jgi:repressor LexA